MMKICPSCGKENNSGMLFCGYCGNRFPEEPAAPLDKESEEPAAPLSETEMIKEQIARSDAAASKPVMKDPVEHVETEEVYEDDEPDYRENDNRYTEPGYTEPNAPEEDRLPEPVRYRNDDGEKAQRSFTDIAKQAFFGSKKGKKKGSEDNPPEKDKEDEKGNKFGRTMFKLLRAFGFFILILVVFGGVTGRLLDSGDAQPTLTPRIRPTNTISAEATETPSAQPTATPVPAYNPIVTEVPDDYMPSDFGQAWDGSVAKYIRIGTGTESDPFIISCASEFALVAEEVNKGNSFTGNCFYIDSDIDFGGREWTPIGYYYDTEGRKLIRAFKGTINGNNHTLKNFKISSYDSIKAQEACSADKALGFFGAVASANIYDLTIEGASLAMTGAAGGEVQAGVFAGYIGSGTMITGCKAEGDVSITSSARILAGVFAGLVSQSTIVESNINGKVSATNVSEINDVGGLCGYSNSAQISANSVDSEVVSRSNGNSYVGGLGGYCQDTVFENNEVVCKTDVSSDSESANIAAGGFVGAAYTCSDIYSLVNSEVKTGGKSAGYVGGYVGYLKDSKVYEMTLGTKTEVTDNGENVIMMTGGAVGFSENSTMDQTVINGTLTSTCLTKNYTGGILGGAKDGKVTNSNSSMQITAYSTGVTKGEIRVGSIAGNVIACPCSGIMTFGSILANSGADCYTGGAFGYIQEGSYNDISCDYTLDSTAGKNLVCGGFAAYAYGKVSLNGCIGASSRKNHCENVYDDRLIAIEN